ncbi:MAG: YjbQ family protein, partial [Planctomycetes bacterium]|nr:YjbQ family protein [Planctomycetota bacterium]
LDITREVNSALAELGAENGVATVFCPHTTAAITINENADPDVCHDWIENMNRLVPADQSYYRHAEGNSDSHVKCSLVGASEQIIVENGKMVLGTWQSIYFAEFDGPRTRKVHVTFIKA